MEKIYNAPDTTDLDENHNWLEEWIEWAKETGLDIEKGPKCCHCGRNAEVGSHVFVLDNELGEGLWIVPKCQEHNTDMKFQIDEVPSEYLMQSWDDEEYRGVMDKIRGFREKNQKIVDNEKKMMPFHAAVIAIYSKEEEGRRIMNKWNEYVGGH